MDTSLEDDGFIQQERGAMKNILEKKSEFSFIYVREDDRRCKWKCLENF